MASEICQIQVGYWLPAIQNPVTKIESEKVFLSSILHSIFVQVFFALGADYVYRSI